MSPEATAAPAPAPVGTENVKRVLKLAFDLTKQGVISFSDGVQITDFFSFIGELSQIPDVIKTSKDLLAELNALDDAKRSELNEYVKTEFDIPNDKAEIVIEHALGMVISAIGLVGEIKAIHTL